MICLTADNLKSKYQGHIHKTCLNKTTKQRSYFAQVQELYA